jgi:hypothetical protein
MIPMLDMNDQTDPESERIKVLKAAFLNFLQSQEFLELQEKNKKEKKLLFCTYRWEGIHGWKGKCSIVLSAEDVKTASEIVPKNFRYSENGKLFVIPVLVTSCRVEK